MTITDLLKEADVICTPFRRITQPKIAYAQSLRTGPIKVTLFKHLD
jgi:hypothetical protein